MRAPLKFSRVSSGFSMHRLHPVLHEFRPHLAVDYAAGIGTPVYAAGDGHVTYAGWKNGLGKCVEIRHPNGYRTVYGHLSRIAPGIDAGARVSQKDRIGSVGQTGNATGPHLHYEVWQGNTPVDPRTLKLPAMGPVSDEVRFAFQQSRDQQVPQLLPVYGPVLASAR
jgi:murein DD-endopeptidase MepM/ murein hydrolase activator NlpD